MSFSIKRFNSLKKDPVAALEDVKLNLGTEVPCFIALFISNNHDITNLGSVVKELFDGDKTTVVACTTAGEIGCDSYFENSISAFSIFSDQYIIKNILIDNLQDFCEVKTDIIRQEVESFSQLYEVKENYSPFGLLLIDGLSVKEEDTLGLLEQVLGNIPLAGGSSGDGLDFGNCYLYNDGVFLKDAASLTLFATDLPFILFKSQHFSPTEHKLVITDAIPNKRIVTEINGEPAADAYAKVLGIDQSEFCPMIFSKYPVMLNVGGEYYVRSIQSVNADKSLTFYCAIDVGIVLTLASREDLYESINKNFINVKESLDGKYEGCLLFECILRKLEVSDMCDKDKSKIYKIYNENRSVGFHTYGEQFGSLHVNQTLTGIAFGNKKND
jgi:hypothetical protein